MENKTNLKTYSAYLTHLKELEKALKKDAAILLAETQSRKIRKAALEVEDESIIIESNTVTSDND